MTATSGSRHNPATMRILSVLCLSVLLASAGCSSAIFGESPDQRGPVGLNVTNAANDTYTFEVSVVELPANVTTRLPDGRIGNYDVSPGLSTYDPGVNQYYTSVEPPNSARLHGRYTLRPGETNISNISASDISEEFAVVVIVHHNDGVVSWVTATCSGDLAYFGVTMRYYGTDSVYDCN